MAQHGGDVANQVFAAADAFFGKPSPAMEFPGNFDEGLGGHAAHPGAGRSQGTLIDEQEVVRPFNYLAQRGKPGTACPDDGHFDFSAHKSTPLFPTRPWITEKQGFHHRENRGHSERLNRRAGKYTTKNTKDTKKNKGQDLFLDLFSQIKVWF
jgi:hypothetical protein